MILKVVPGMADSTGSRLALEAATGSKLVDVTELISRISALQRQLAMSHSMHVAAAAAASPMAHTVQEQTLQEAAALALQASPRPGQNF